MDNKTLIETVKAEDFVVYLAAKAPTTVVGKARIPRGCPVSLFLSSLCETPTEFVVGPEAIGFGMPRRYTTNVPPWITKFVRLVDANRLEDAITAHQALKYVKA